MSQPNGAMESLVDAAMLKPRVQFSADVQQKQQPQDSGHGRCNRNCLEPKEIYEHIADGGEVKPKNSFLRESVLGFVAGAYIAFGFSTCMIAAGQLSHEYRKAEPGMFNLLFGAYGFPVGLSMCVINGASLFTSNIAYMMAAFMEKKASAVQGVVILVQSYFMNFAGCLFLVMLMWQGQVFAHREEFTIELALKKISYSFGATVTKGILCNWLVCMAVWQGNAAQDITGKLLGIWFPISAFVTMGFEHCVANMYVIPLAMRLGAPITVGTFLVKNLIPATIGNIIGGGVFVAMAYGLAFGDWEKTITAATNRALGRSTSLSRSNSIKLKAGSVQANITADSSTTAVTPRRRNRATLENAINILPVTLSPKPNNAATTAADDSMRAPLRASPDV